MSDTCTQCGNKYQRIAQHWSTSSTCKYPPFSDHQRKIIIGLLMGDGCILRESKRKPRLICGMISSNYLKYINKEFGIFGNGVSLIRTGEQVANRSCERGFSPNAKTENYHNIYRWRSMSHPELEEFADWYSTGEKVWPDDIELTPTVLKHWYCGDGHWNDSVTSNRIIISMSNEINNQEKVDRIFENVGLPSPSNYSISKRKDGSKKCNAEFTVDQSKKLWEYMGKPLPDFEYKWPEEYH